MPIILEKVTEIIKSRYNVTIHSISYGIYSCAQAIQIVIIEVYGGIKHIMKSFAINSLTILDLLAALSVRGIIISAQTLLRMTNSFVPKFSGIVINLTKIITKIGQKLFNYSFEIASKLLKTIEELSLKFLNFSWEIIKSTTKTLVENTKILIKNFVS